MAEARTNRRLAAILAADVVGYSRMMASDEAGTLAALKRHREIVFDPAVAQHNGRIVKLIGDGTLVEFGSVVDAVKCALAVQTAAATSETAGREDHPAHRHQSRRRHHRRRRHLWRRRQCRRAAGAAGRARRHLHRLDRQRERRQPDRRCLQGRRRGSGQEHRPPDPGLEMASRQTPRPMASTRQRPPARRRSPDTPSIAVLPFANMSGDPEQEYFSDGITEDIITDLSKVAGLLVIARNSSFAYKGKNVDIRTVARELGVRSVLEGSIRRAGNRVRITAQLIDAGTGGHLWAERYDRDLTDIFAVQDEVTRQIVGALKVTLSPAEKARLAATAARPTSRRTTSSCAARELLFGPTKNSRRLRTRQRASSSRRSNAIPAYAEPMPASPLLTCSTIRTAGPTTRPLACRGRAACRPGDRKGPQRALRAPVPALVAMLRQGLRTVRRRKPTSALSLNPNYAAGAQRSRRYRHLLRATRWRRSRTSSAPCASIPAFASNTSISSARPIWSPASTRRRRRSSRSASCSCPRPICRAPFLPSALGHLGRDRRGPPGLARTQGDQSEVFVRRTHRPAAVQEPGGRRPDQGGSDEGRLAGLTGRARPVTARPAIVYREGRPPLTSRDDEGAASLQEGPPQGFGRSASRQPDLRHRRRGARPHRRRDRRGGRSSASRSASSPAAATSFAA